MLFEDPGGQGEPDGSPLCVSLWSPCLRGQCLLMSLQRRKSRDHNAPSSVESDMRVRLEIVEGPEAGRVFEFDQADSFLVGRSPRAHCILQATADPQISRHHFLLDIRPPRCILQDLESKNGTFVNGSRIETALLEDRDEIRAGRTLFRIRIFAVEPPEPDDEGEFTPAGYSDDSIAPRSGESLRPGGFDTLAAAGEFPCMTCGRDLGRWARNDGWADELPRAHYLCPTCTASARSPNVMRETIGDYRILRELGRGGMGVVYKAVHRRSRRLCAVKEILPDAATDERSLRLFDREIAVQSKVTHPNLARILERGRDHDHLFFVVEYLEGGDTHELISARIQGPPPIGLVVRIIADVLRGLQALHDHGFVHRDLKPRNLLLSHAYDDPRMTAKITDYGLAKSFEEAGNSLFAFTRVGDVAGSMMFMAPEQILDYRFVKPPADVYSVGVSLYFLLTRKYSTEFPAENPGGRHPIHAMIEDPPVPILERRPDLPPTLAEVVDRAVRKDVTERYGTATEFLAALNALDPFGEPAP